MSATPRSIILCADDYGIAPGVNAAIRDLIARDRLNATSVMTVAPAFNPDELGAARLRKMAARCELACPHIDRAIPTLVD